MGLLGNMCHPNGRSLERWGLLLRSVRKGALGEGAYALLEKNEASWTFSGKIVTIFEKSPCTFRKIRGRTRVPATAKLC